MNSDEKKILEIIYGAVKAVHDLSYFSSKQDPENELKYALDLLSKIIENEINEDTALSLIAKRQIKIGITYKEWISQCKIAIFDVAMKLKNNNITEACKLIKCHRESYYYAYKKRRNKKCSNTEKPKLDD